MVFDPTTGGDDTQAPPAAEPTTEEQKEVGDAPAGDTPAAA
jgi:hypothetical protein